MKWERERERERGREREREDGGKDGEGRMEREGGKWHKIIVTMYI